MRLGQRPGRLTGRGFRSGATCWRLCSSSTAGFASTYPSASLASGSPSSAASSARSDVASTVSSSDSPTRSRIHGPRRSPWVDSRSRSMASAVASVTEGGEAEAHVESLADRQRRIRREGLELGKDGLAQAGEAGVGKDALLPRRGGVVDGRGVEGIGQLAAVEPIAGQQRRADAQPEVRRGIRQQGDAGETGTCRDRTSPPAMYPDRRRTRRRAGRALSRRPPPDRPSVRPTRQASRGADR